MIWLRRAERLLPLGQAKAANATTPSRNFLAIAGVCTGSLFMLFLHDLVAAG